MPALFASDPSLPAVIGGLIAIPLLIAVNAFFVAAEFAFVAVRRSRVEELVNQGNPRAKTLLDALDDMNDEVAAAQLGITLASIALGIAGDAAIHALIQPLFDGLPAGWKGAVTNTLSLAVTLSIITFMHVVFGEQMPKIAALQSAETIGMRIARPMVVFTRLSRPAVRLLNGASGYGLRKLGYDPDAEEGDVHSVDELRLLVEGTEEAGLMTSEQADVVMNVFALSDKKVRDCMVPWAKVAALEIGTQPDQILAVVRQGSHTRLPVYDGSPDAVIGVVNTKDLFYLFSLNGVVALVDAVYEPLFLQADIPVSKALDQLRKAHRHMAVVQDAGKTVGILTLEDVLEEIVGEIEDEHDRPSPKLRRTVLLQMLRRKRR